MNKQLTEELLKEAQTIQNQMKCVCSLLECLNTAIEIRKLEELRILNQKLSILPDKII